jgi:hypothetical protein
MKKCVHYVAFPLGINLFLRVFIYRRSEKKNVRFNLAISNEKEPFNPNEDQVFLVFKDEEKEQFALFPSLR